MLRAHLPARYAVQGGFVIDSAGHESEQIDVIIYDAQYSALVFNRGGLPYVPAESVYAVFESKQDIKKKHVDYAKKKAASVRRLLRTSVRIPHAGGVYAPKPPFPILAGLLALESTWTPPFGRPFVDACSSAKEDERLDLGCSVKDGAYELSFKRARPAVTASERDLGLATFVLTLLGRLQERGTVPAIDYRAYLAGAQAR